MPPDVQTELERLRANDDHLWRMLLGDPASGQPGFRHQLEEIKADTQKIKGYIQWLGMGYGLLVGVLMMVVLQAVYAGMK